MIANIYCGKGTSQLNLVRNKLIYIKDVLKLLKFFMSSRHPHQEYANIENS